MHKKFLEVNRINQTNGDKGCINDFLQRITSSLEEEDLCRAVSRLDKVYFFRQQLVLSILSSLVQRTYMQYVFIRNTAESDPP